MDALALIMTMAAYLLGSVSSAVLICRLLKLPDPRNVGSNNPGATNVLRIGGKGAAVSVLLCDMLKGTIPVWGGTFLVSILSFLALLLSRRALVTCTQFSSTLKGERRRYRAWCHCSNWLRPYRPSYADLALGCSPVSLLFPCRTRHCVSHTVLYLDVQTAIHPARCHVVLSNRV